MTKPKKPELPRLLEFHELLLSFQAIERHVCYVDNGASRAENDSEHSYNLAMTAWFLAGHFPKLDTTKVLKYALAHDLLEVHAGDTSVFGSEEQLASKAEREHRAVEQLAYEWQDFPDLIQAIKSYESKADEEAKFVYALDKIMPIILNIVHQGHSWEKAQNHPGTAARHQKRKSENTPRYPRVLSADIQFTDQQPAFLSQ